ncbi:MAG: hypothetical protein ACYTG2_09400 [Planctomycetota bacterium]
MKPQVKIPLLYFVFGVTWILLSDRVAGALTSGPEELARIQTLKGWTFIAITTVLLYVCVRGHLQREAAAQAQTVAVFHRTMRSVQHIMNNFLNQMLHFKTRAEDVGAFNEEMLREFDRLITDTSDRITQLSELPDVDAARLAQPRQEKVMA